MKVKGNDGRKVIRRNPGKLSTYKLYFFLINNFAVVHSNSSIPETVKNRTCVHINIFA
jgi:hypothetical protein